MAKGALFSHLQTNRDRYEGNFRNGEKEGQGAFVFPLLSALAMAIAILATK